MTTYLISFPRAAMVVPELAIARMRRVHGGIPAEDDNMGI